MGDRVQFKRPTTRFYLRTISPEYGDEPYLDVKVGLTTGEQRELDRLGEVISAEFAAIRQAQADNKPAPPFSDAYYKARDAQFAVYCTGTNVTHDADGNALPPCTEAGFWAAAGQDVKDGVLNHFEKERAEQADRVRGQAFTKKPSGS